MASAAEDMTGLLRRTRARVKNSTTKTYTPIHLQNVIAIIDLACACAVCYYLKLCEATFLEGVLAEGPQLRPGSLE